MFHPITFQTVVYILEDCRGEPEYVYTSTTNNLLFTHSQLWERNVFVYVFIHLVYKIYSL